MKVLLSGGGTGGHIYPALSIVNRLKELDPTTEFLYVGTDKGLESKLVPEAGLDFKSIEIQGIRRSLSPENLRTIWLMLTSSAKAKKIIRDFRPDVVIGTGGYVCAPVLYAAARLGVPTVIHEQNSVAGITNKFLSRYVDKICICFDEVRKDFAKVEDKVVFTGNPRAQEVSQIKEQFDLESVGLKNDQPTVLIFGGSRGAEKLNQSFVESIDYFNQANFQTIMVTGKIHYEEITKSITTPLGDQVKILPYIDNMPALFNRISAVVSRSGATTITELQAKGMPSILIPSPYVTENHQEVNADSLVKIGAAEKLLEKDLSATSLFKMTEELISDASKREAMSEKALSLATPKATDHIIQLMADLAGEDVYGLG